MIERIGRRLRRELERFDRRKVLPDRAVILLTNPRSGSTWLFDALRCHPALYVHPKADLWQSLGLHGRRYPRDLSGDSDNAVEIEVMPGKLEMLPCFTLPPKVIAAAGRHESYALEKCHPHFFDHAVEMFVGRLKALDARGSARMIYQTRDPRASVVSFLRYKERNPAWNPRIEPDMVIPHMRRIYQSLLATAMGFPGLVVDYAGLESDTEATLKRTFSWLWPDEPSASDEALLAAITEATGRSKRGPTAFLGAQVSIADDTTYAPLFAQFNVDLDLCYAAYDGLCRMAGEERSA